MATITTFRELDVWQMAMKLVMDCYDLTDRYPTYERYGLTSQTRRSAVSIPSNVAEGHNRHADKAYAEFPSAERRAPARYTEVPANDLSRKAQSRTT